MDFRKGVVLDPACTPLHCLALPGISHCQEKLQKPQKQPQKIQMGNVK